MSYTLLQTDPSLYFTPAPSNFYVYPETTLYERHVLNSLQDTTMLKNKLPITIMGCIVALLVVGLTLILRNYFTINNADLSETNRQQIIQVIYSPSIHLLQSTVLSRSLRLIKYGFSNIEYDLYNLKIQRMNEYIQKVYIPPIAKHNLNTISGDTFPLMKKTRDFLASDCQVMLILGDSGAGKSTFNRHLEYKLWQEYKPGDRIPLFFNLPTLKQPENELIQEQLRIYGFSEPQTQELLKCRQLTLICDGYDECQLHCNLHTTNYLNQSGQRDVKLIISCRSHYLGSDYHNQFVPRAPGQYNRGANDLFQECVITSFTRKQIEEYVEKYVPLEPRTWVKADYLDKSETIPSLIDLVQNPFLLTLCLATLPSIVQSEDDLSKLQVTRVQLYDSFVQHWLEVNKRRL